MGASAACVILFVLVACVFYMATLSLSDHRNLYYTMWRVGLRDYDATVAKAGLIDDREFRESLKGLTVEEFEKVFPHTFYEMKRRPPSAREGRSFFVDDYSASRSIGQDDPFVGWMAVFDDGRLIEFEWHKGV